MVIFLVSECKSWTGWPVWPLQLPADSYDHLRALERCVTCFFMIPNVFYASSSSFEVQKSSILVYQNSESIRNLKDYLNYLFVFLSQSTWFCHGYKRYLSVVSVFRSLWCLESILRSISWLETNLSASRCHGSRYFNLTNHDFHQVCFRYICRFMKCCETRENIFGRHYAQ